MRHFRQGGTALGVEGGCCPRLLVFCGYWKPGWCPLAGVDIRRRRGEEQDVLSADLRPGKWLWSPEAR